MRAESKSRRKNHAAVKQADFRSERMYVYAHGRGSCVSSLLRFDGTRSSGT